MSTAESLTWHYQTLHNGCWAKPKLNITWRDLCSPGTDPTPRSNHREEDRAMAQAEQSPQGDYLEQKSRCKAEYSNTQQDLPVSWYT
jgi:hypothetical protein